MRAPAKVNLYLHVGPPGADRYHPLASLIAFADVGDRVEIDAAEAFALSVTGPFAAHAPADESNLTLRAARRFADQLGGSAVRIRLDKQVPAGAGLGGGSADAAAVLRLMRDRFRPDVSDGDLQGLGADLGADVPACVGSRTVIAEGRGERLRPGPDLPPLPAVLVWPGVACATAEIYRAYDAGVAPGTPEAPATPEALDDVEAVAACLVNTRNDLQLPAEQARPAIAQAVAALGGEGGALFSRMSGSGSAVFGLFRSAQAADAAADRLGGANPAWWVRTCTLGEAAD